MVEEKEKKKTNNSRSLECKLMNFTSETSEGDIDGKISNFILILHFFELNFGANEAKICEKRS